MTTTGNEDVVDTTYAGHHKDNDYRQVLEEIKRKGECPFCPENLPRANTIIYRAGKWVSIKNRWPYEHAAVHFVFVPDEHKTDIGAVSGDDWNDIQALIEKLRQENPILQIGGGLVVRFGTNSGVTVRHLHFHLIAPVTDPSTGKVVPGEHVNFPIG